MMQSLHDKSWHNNEYDLLNESEISKMTSSNGRKRFCPLKPRKNTKVRPSVKCFVAFRVLCGKILPCLYDFKNSIEKSNQVMVAITSRKFKGQNVQNSQIKVNDLIVMV